MSAERLKDIIDLHELAQRFGWDRPHSRGNYRSPHHPDKNPSVSIFADGRRYKDHSSGSTGTCIDMTMFHFGWEYQEAYEWLCKEYHVDRPKPAPRQPDKPQTLAEYIAAQSLRNPKPAIDYLVNERGIPAETAELAAKCHAVGWNDYCKEEVPAGEFGHGGPALACIVRTLNPGQIAAVELRYADPGLNGGVKTQTQGVKDGAPFLVRPRDLEKARCVVVCESPINALSIEACKMKGTIAMATRGTETIESIDWSVLRGKEVIVAMDPDPPVEKGPKKGQSPGTEAGWAVYDLLVAQGISAMMVDQDEWTEGEDLNDILKRHGPDELRVRLRRLSRWAIPGQPGKREFQRGRPRLFLPPKDWGVYGNYRVTSDFSSVIELDREGEPVHHDLAGFRIASMSRLTVQSSDATLTGCRDNAPETQYVIHVQIPRRGPNLMRKVLTDEQVHSESVWGKYGTIYKKNRFFRLVNIWERAADIGATTAANLVGLCWKNGHLTVNEGRDTFFRVPHQQCPYHTLTFPRGSTRDAQMVIAALQRTYGNCNALFQLVWGMGAHLKAFTQFWPHCLVSGDKASGKTTIARKLGSIISMKVFGGQTMRSDFRMMTSISGTFHPVCWEEISNQGAHAMQTGQSLLQDCYQSNVSPRQSDMVEFVHCAPVLVVGEDTDMDNVIGKTVRVYLDVQRQGEKLTEDLPRFPVYNWLRFLASKKKRDIRDLYSQSHGYLESNCMADIKDGGASRMMENYACVGMAWYLLCEFAGIDVDTGDFMRHLVALMNEHIKSTKAAREPWVWITETILSEMAAGRYAHPFAIDGLTHGELCLIVRPSHMLDHIRHNSHLRATWDQLPIRSSQVYKRQLDKAGVIQKDGVEKVIRQKRYGHMTALSVERLERYGLLVPVESVG